LRQEATSFSAAVTSSRRSPGRVGWLLLSPLILWAFAFVVAPAVIMLVYSFARRGTLGGVVLEFTLENYAGVLDPVYLRIVIRSIVYAGITTVICLAAGYPVAYLIGRADERWRNLLLMAVMIPFWTSFLIRTYAWLIILDPEFPVFRWLGVDLLYTTRAVYIGVVYNYLPLMILPLYAALERLDWSLVEAAQDLGDPPWRSFRRITLPLALPGIVAGSLLVFIPLTGEYLIPAILGGNKTAYTGSLIAQQFSEVHDWPLGSAVAVVVIVGMTVVLLAFSGIANRGAVRRG